MPAQCDGKADDADADEKSESGVGEDDEGEGVIAFHFQSGRAWLHQAGFGK